MNVVELKNICRARGLAITGRKRDIIDRLEEFDENGPVWDEIEPVWDEIERPIHIPTFRKSRAPVIHLAKMLLQLIISI